MRLPTQKCHKAGARSGSTRYSIRGDINCINLKSVREVIHLFQCQFSLFYPPNLYIKRNFWLELIGTSSLPEKKVKTEWKIENGQWEKEAQRDREREKKTQKIQACVSVCSDVVIFFLVLPRDEKHSFLIFYKCKYEGNQWEKSKRMWNGNEKWRQQHSNNTQHTHLHVIILILRCFSICTKHRADVVGSVVRCATSTKFIYI